ncbi:ribonuclease HII [Actinomyces faecalis]|uniref:ribonuclease HII n=1 Tax=Actinomyces faecalis TaxID=2722820 RepID=UPI001FD2819B|nr:ribonuclease HII [Actinomyces faecalis]
MSPRRPASTRLRPDRELETELLGRYPVVAGMDEVGRGALAGPVSVGLAVVDASTSQDLPPGLADSKQLSPARREALVEPCRSWARGHAVAHASPAEIDALGIVGALRLAGLRALVEVASRGPVPAVVILDGVADWLSEPADDLLSGLSASQPRHPAVAELGDQMRRLGLTTPPVRMQVKADARCAVVAAASVLAKVERDRVMTYLEDPGYGWAANKGYASPAHVEGLRRLGACEQHRRSWHLPGLEAFATG